MGKIQRNESAQIVLEFSLSARNLEIGCKNCKKFEKVSISFAGN